MGVIVDLTLQKKKKISEFDVIYAIQNKAQGEKNKQNPCDFWDNIRQPNICLCEFAVAALITTISEA